MKGTMEEGRYVDRSKADEEVADVEEVVEECSSPSSFLLLFCSFIRAQGAKQVR